MVICDVHVITTSCNYRRACGAYHNTGHRRLNIPSQGIPVAFSNKFRLCKLSAPPAELSVNKARQNYHFRIIKFSNEMDIFGHRTTEFSASTLKVWVFFFCTSNDWLKNYSQDIFLGLGTKTANTKFIFL